MNQGEGCRIKDRFQDTLFRFASRLLVCLVILQIGPVGELSRQDLSLQGTAAPIFASFGGSPAEAGMLSVFGPRKYLRATGKPVDASDRFSAAAGKATLYVVNGEADGSNRISSAVITLNGKNVFRTMAFNEEVYRLRACVDLAPQNLLAVKLESKPGSYLTLEIVAEGQNRPPVANAGPDQTKRVGQTAQLDGSGSIDADGDPLSYYWSITHRPTGSFAELSDPTAVRPIFVIDKPGAVEVQLVVNDGKVDSAADTVVINTENTPPVAHAGLDQTATVGGTVRLDGSGSTDVDGDELIYDWTQFTVPDGSSASLSDPASVKPSFLVDKPGTYEATLIVNDGQADSAADTVVVTTVNTPPVADAGPDQKAHPGDIIALDGRASSDAEGDSLTYHWSLIKWPDSSSADLTNADTVTPTLEVDVLGEYIAQLIVNDGRADSAADTVTISSENLKPVANAGVDREVFVAEPVTLDGSGSFDPDDDPLSYTWSFLSKPSPTAAFDDPHAQRPSFLPDLAGEYIVQLIVYDVYQNSDPDTVTITYDKCPDDPNKTDPGVCGCGVPDTDTDTDADGTPDCNDLCPNDPNKTEPGVCGCGVRDTDTDADGTPDCDDLCPNDPNKTEPGVCGCGVTETDTDGDGVPDCRDGCPFDAGKIDPGACGCGTADKDTDGDATLDCLDECPSDPKKTAPGICGCGLADIDTDGDGTLDCHDGCPNDPAKTEPGLCGCEVADTDADGDGTPDCLDGCPGDAAKTAPGICGCGVPDTDNDNDGILDCLQVPPDPRTVAPPLNLTVPTDLFSATQFLYTGANPIQTGVAEGTIQPYRAAVLRGKVLNRDGNPLPGVVFAVLNHPELGQTLSRVDGMFDLAVNGGGLLTVKYGKPGYLEAQRQVNVPWQDYVVLPDVTLVQLDPQVTPVNLTDPGMKVARGSLSSDADGSRQATLLFPEGITAEMVLPDGSTQPIDLMNVRATEFTVGPDGPKAMPAELPPNVAYTYAVEFTVDEALAAGAKEVRFSQPVMHYLENFLGFPVGTTVPLGYYDRFHGMWVASDSGKVIKILGISGGMADLDTNGDEAADDPATLAALGVTDAERAKLIEPGLYATGQTLWRVPTPHFSPWDDNWPMRWPEDARPPQQPVPEEKPSEEPCKVSGSIVECQDQSLGEKVPVTGTPFNLHYTSDRVPGRQALLSIPLSSDTVPASLKRIDLNFTIAGIHFSTSYPAAPNLTHTFLWGGKDIYGRAVQGGQRFLVRVGYVYDVVYARTSRFSSTGEESLIIRARAEATQWQEMELRLFRLDASAQGLGGWTLSVHHTYDGGTGTLYLGDGNRQSGEALNNTDMIQTVAGTGYSGSSGDGGPALEARLEYPMGLAIGPDGSIYIGDYDASVKRVGPDGIIRTFAGRSNSAGFAGDGGPATSARLSWAARDLALGPDGSLYILDRNNYRIRKVDPNGIISTVAGPTAAGTPVCRLSDALANACGDGGPATQAKLGWSHGMDVGADGSIYLAETDTHRIRRIGPDGIINTVAGTGIPGDVVEGVPALAAGLSKPNDVAVARDGSLYIADTEHYIVRKVGNDGIIRTIAGIPGDSGYSGEGLPATQSKFYYPMKLFIDANDILYVNDSRRSTMLPRIRRVWPSGIMDTVAGDGTGGFWVDFQPAIKSPVRTWGDGSMAVGPDGNLYIAGDSCYRIGKVSPAMPKRGPGDEVDILIASRDGSEVYQLDRYWRHIKTLHGLTGTVLYQFDYDANGYLQAVIDGDGKTTTIERGADGKPAAVVGPYGHRTTLQLDVNGYIASITNPANEAVQFSYADSGLMSQVTDARGNSFRLSCDALGRVNYDENPAGGFLTLQRTDQSPGFTVTTNTALNRATSYQTEYLSTGLKRSTNTFPTGAQTVSLVAQDGSENLVLPDGMSIQTVPGGDPRFGLMAPIDMSRITKTPSGLTLYREMEQRVSLANPYDPFTITSQTDYLDINGKYYTFETDVVTRRIHQMTPVGRSSLIYFDARERLLSYQPSGVEPFTLSYDGMGRLSDYGQATTRWSLAYDTMGRVSTLANSAGEITAFEYDNADRLTGLQTPLGNSYAFDHDANGNPVRVAMPNGKVHGLSYNAINLLSGYTPPDTTLSYLWSYNADKDLAQKRLPGGRTVDFVYDAAGRIIRMQYPEATVQFRYADLTDRLFQIERSPGDGSFQQIEHGYDGSLLTALTYAGVASGAYSYAYNHDLLLTGVGFASGADSVSIPLVRDKDGLVTGYGSFSILRDAGMGRITSIGDDGSGTHAFQVQYSYDALGRLLGRTHTVNGIPIFSFQTTRDDTGRIIQRIDTATHNYFYDADGRLTKVFAADPENPEEQYSYDENANRTGTRTAAAHYDAQDRITDQGGVTYRHDDDGFMTQRGADTLVYSARGELHQATAGGTTVSYAYDGLGRRVGRKVASGDWQQYFYGSPSNPYLVTASRDAAGVLTIYHYDDFAHLFAFQRGTDWYYVATDQVGTPRIVSDAGGTIVKALDFDSYGVLLSDSHPGFELVIGFAGGINDALTGLVRFGTRDYDPMIGRWTARDPVLFAGGQLNLYAYVFNDPVNFADPSGTEYTDPYDEVHEALYALFVGSSKGAGGPYDPDRGWEAVAFNRGWQQNYWRCEGKGQVEKSHLAQLRKQLELPLLVRLALGVNDIFTEMPKTSYQLLKGIGLIKGTRPNSTFGIDTRNLVGGSVAGVRG